MSLAFYKSDLDSFLKSSINEIIGEITRHNQFDSNRFQNNSWETQITILQNSLIGLAGNIYFEFSIPRMGKRVDTIVIINDVVFVIEFKVGEKLFNKHDIIQVWDYALDLKNFHKPSHGALIFPILVATEAKSKNLDYRMAEDNLASPILSNKLTLKEAINLGLKQRLQNIKVDGKEYAYGEYQPTPTIIEAAISLYNSHTVDEITRSDAAGKNLKETTNQVLNIIETARSKGQKVICFVTGVPGAGKTLVGLRIATSQLSKTHDSNSVYLSGNGPLVTVLQEALARDRVNNEKLKGNKISKTQVKSSVKTFIQNIHHYRDAYLVDTKAPFDHVAIFDEAQRAWNHDQTVKFMQQRKGLSGFDKSEPEFLISCLDRHEDWSVVICLVGNGQEINTGEAGISEWLNAIDKQFSDWKVYLSSSLIDENHIPSNLIDSIQKKTEITFSRNLHLGVSMRSFRAEYLAQLVTNILDRNLELSQALYSQLKLKYPIYLTRNLGKAKEWLKAKSRGSERYGIVVSSQAQRLKPHAIDVRTQINPVHWFLNDRDDVRSSYYLEDVATEFQIQGLELDWTCLVWDADLRHSESGWETYSFKGNKWQNILKQERKTYLINAYRVLLTRARKGMVIVVPEGNNDDPTRFASFYDPTFEYLESVGIDTI